ncbi:MAG: phosphotransferase enzyme family protein [Planctomycetota bacterium]|jgi:hypothetical protein
MPDLGAVIREFDVPGDLVASERWGSGHINDSYRVAVREGDRERGLLLQRVNDRVFPDPVAVTENIGRVTEHLRAKLEAAGRGDLDRRVLRLVPTRDGGLCRRDAEGGYWRAYRFIDGARTHDVVTSPGMAREAARAFGEFQRDLAALPGPRLSETIPGFHGAPERFAALVRAVEEDSAGRVAGARDEIALALAREEMTGVLLDAHRAGEMPERVTHNDTKINNVLFDSETGEGLCVIDLDTVMPGLSLHDFGDLVRTCVTDAAEDERDLERVRARPDLFAALVEGYLAAVGDLLTATERGLLLFSGKLMTFLIGIRFLTDHLSGDTYFRTHREGHNLERCRAQLRLLGSLEAQEADFVKIAARA